MLAAQPGSGIQHTLNPGFQTFVVEPNPDVIKRAVFTNCCLKKIKGGTLRKSTYSVLSKVTSTIQPGVNKYFKEEKK